MSQFTSPSLKVEFDCLEDQNAVLLEEIVYEIGFKGSKDYFTVPRGFNSNGASVPRLFWVFLPPWGTKTSKAAILHDFFYDAIERRVAIKIPTYKKADDEFYLAMLAMQVHPVKARIVWFALRLVNTLKRKR